MRSRAGRMGMEFSLSRMRTNFYEAIIFSFTTFNEFLMDNLRICSRYSLGR